jgi:hypothetical protein
MNTELFFLPACLCAPSSGGSTKHLSVRSDCSPLLSLYQLASTSTAMELIISSSHHDLAHAFIETGQKDTAHVSGWETNKS